MNRNQVLGAMIAAASIAILPPAAPRAHAAGFGSRLPPERVEMTDEVTGVKLTRLTTAAAMDDKIYQTHPNWTSDGRHLIFVSGRKGVNEFFALEEATGAIIQITDSEPGSFAVSRGRGVMFSVRGVEVGEVDLTALTADSAAGTLKPKKDYDRKLGSLPAGSQLSGTFTEDATGGWLYFGLKDAAGKHSIRKLDIRPGGLGTTEPVIEVAFRVGHQQAHPTRTGVISYCFETEGDATQRMWLVNADGTGNRPFYAETYNEWVTHEVWWTDDRMLFVIWAQEEAMKKKPYGIASVSLGDSTSIVHCQHPFWHVCGTPDGRFAIGDTHQGELFLVNIGTGEKRLLTQGHRPAGQQSHPHQSLDPTGKRVLFVSTKFGNYDLMTAEIPEWDALKAEK